MSNVTQASNKQHLHNTFVFADNHPLCVWENAPKTVVASLVLIHGRTWSSLPNFDLHTPTKQMSLLRDLEAQDIKAFAIDLRGYGRTMNDPSGFLTPHRAVRDTTAILEWIVHVRKLPLPYLFGWSYGSMVAQLTAQKQPELISGLILFDYSTPPLSGYKKRDVKITKCIQNTVDEARADFIDASAISNDVVDAYITSALTTDPCKVWWQRLYEWNELNPRKITTPTLILESIPFSQKKKTEHGDFFQSIATRRKKRVVVPGGHAAFLENSRYVFIDTLASFMK